MGKSVQALVAIAVMQIETATTMQQQQQPQQSHQRPRSLIVCPAVLTRHWQREIGKFFPEKMMRPMLYEDINTGTGKGTGVRASSTNANANNKGLGTTTTSDHHNDDGGCIYGGDVVIVSYEALRRDKGGFFTRDCHNNGCIDGGISTTAPSSWLAVVLDEVG